MCMRISKIFCYENPCNITGVGDTQAQRDNLRIYVQIGILERGKVETLNWLQLEGVELENESITILCSAESSAIVPLRSWKHDRGIGTSQQKLMERRVR